MSFPSGRSGPIRLLLPLAFTVLASLVLAWDGMLTPAFSDYEREAEPSLLALRAGHLMAFVDHLPAYGGSLILRSPFALLPGLWHGGDLALFRSVAVPCLIAAGGIGLLLWSRLDITAGRPGAAWLALALCVANPLTLRALEFGHPEELLGGALCVGAMLAALDRRPGLSGLLVGLAVANKAWGLFAVGPVVLALPDRRVRALLVGGGTAGLVMAPILFTGAASLQATTAAAQHSFAIFQPWQAWWFLGAHGHVVHGLYGAKPGYRAAPGWINGIAHPLIGLMAIALCLSWWRTRDHRRPRPQPHDALLLLALIMLVRCMLDPWNIGYYALPCVLALTAWEAVALRRTPWLSLTLTLTVWTTFELITRVATPDVQALFYLGWSIPLTVGLAVRLYAPTAWERRVGRLGDPLRARLPTLARLASSRAPAPTPLAAD